MIEPSDNDKALALKAEGNELHRARAFEGARRLWTEAIEKFGKTADASTIRATRCNRAAANLELENWAEVTEDCSEVFHSEPVVDMLSIKALRRCAKAYICSASRPFEDALEVFELQQDACVQYQQAHPENTIVLFSRAEEDTVRQIKALIKSKEEYEAIHPPSEGIITYRYEVILRSQFPHEEDDDMRFRDIRHIFWYSGPRVQHIEDCAEYKKERRAVVASTMVEPHEKTVLQRQNAEFGDSWGCVVCGRKATVVHHHIQDALHHDCSRVEDYASAVCAPGGYCWWAAATATLSGTFRVA